MSEFEATGLAPAWRAGFAAPYVGEARVRLGLCLREHVPLAINGTHFVIGEIVQVQLPAHCVGDDGAVEIAAAGGVALGGLDAYHRVQRLRRMQYAQYARPYRPPQPLPEAPWL